MRVNQFTALLSARGKSESRRGSMALDATKGEASLRACVVALERPMLKVLRLRSSSERKRGVYAHQPFRS